MQETKYYCDRCKKEMTQEGYIRKGKWIYFERGYYTPSSQTKNYLLCQKCVKKLEDFLKGEE